MIKKHRYSFDDELVKIFFLITSDFLSLIILEEELHRLPRQEGSSSAHLLQTVYGKCSTPFSSSYKYVLMIFVLSKTFIRAM